MPTAYEEQLKMHYVRSDPSPRKFDNVKKTILDYAHSITGVATQMDLTPLGREKDDENTNQWSDQEWANWMETLVQGQGQTEESGLDALQKGKGGKAKGKGSWGKHNYK